MAPSTDLHEISQHHHIVALETHFCPIPEFILPKPHTYTLTSYLRTTQEQLVERVQDASILITTAIALNASILSAAVSPNLQLIVVMATGTDSIDREACRARGIIVCNCAGANVTAVAEHAIGMYFSTRRRFVETQTAIRANGWLKKGTLIPMLKDENGRMPLTCEAEVLGLIGYGAIGTRIARMGQALGMRIVIAERKGSTTIREDRVSFEDAIRKSTVLVVVVPRTAETLGLIGKAELDQMSSSTVLINVSRGGIIDESAVVTALQARQIAGAAFDVFAQEPAGSSTSPLLAANTEGLNLLTTPHTAWLANSTMETLQYMAQKDVEGWCAGRPVNIVQ